MSRAGVMLTGVASAVLAGCMHYNTLYNAERLFRDAEAHRRAGLDSVAQARYEDVIRKTADAYRDRPNDGRAARTLFLLGRAHLRTGDAYAALGALEEAHERASGAELRSEILVYWAAARSGVGDEDGALRLVNEALRGGLTGEALADALLIRGTSRLSGRSSATGWVDLDRAGVERAVRIEAGLEQLRLSLRHREPDRAHAALSGLLAERSAGERLDTIVGLLHLASDTWGPGATARLLSGADSTRWGQPARGRVRLERAKLRFAADDRSAAFEEATRVAASRGAAGADARLLLAAWRLREAPDLGVAASVRSVLLPAIEDSRADRLVRALEELNRYAGMGLDEPLGWFAAGEVARDDLRAPLLARGLFLAYADTDPSAPWAPKALLAALDVSGDEEDRDWLRGRLEAHADSPYVLAAEGKQSEGLEALEEELQVRLGEVTGR